MATTDIITALRLHPFLEDMAPSHLETLASLAFEVTFREDQVIFRQFDSSSFFYLILDGKVALEIPTLGRVIRIQTVGQGEELGWSSLLSQVTKQFSARSLEPVRALAFDGARLLAACEADPAFGYIILRKVLRVVAERLQATRLQVIDIYSKKGYKPQ